jgi:hypothetical protein
MLKITARIFLALMVPILVHATALAPHHIVTSNTPLYVKDGISGTTYNTFTGGGARLDWVEGGPARARVDAWATLPGGQTYKFALMRATRVDADTIEGTYYITLDGRMVCNRCKGKAYGLSQPVGNYFKLYIGTPRAYEEKWLFSGKIDTRLDT